jgi:hypothetical protein
MFYLSDFLYRYLTDFTITGSKLCKNAHVHHMDTKNYTDLTMEKFVALNSMSHQCTEFIYSAKDGWQNAVTQIIEICKHMDYWKVAKN